MMTSTPLDARGLSCPEPAMLARRALMEANAGTLVVLLDSVASRENVSRTARHLGWEIQCETQPDGTYALVLTK
jgi:TusA-related sulfurtransferase